MYFSELNTFLNAFSSSFKSILNLLISFDNLDFVLLSPICLIDNSAALSKFNELFSLLPFLNSKLAKSIFFLISLIFAFFSF